MCLSDSNRFKKKLLENIRHGGDLMGIVEMKHEAKMQEWAEK